MTTNQRCPKCGRPVSGEILGGLCPECMLKVGAATGSAATAPIEPRSGATGPGGEGREVYLPDGSTFGPYRILRRIGHGGMGVVYEAEEAESGRRVALKIIRERLDSPQDRARFLREGRLAASINHPNCVYVFGTDEIEGIPAIAMEFVPGGTLERRLRHEGPLPVAEAVDAVLQVIEGLEAARTRGILHRDIKPSNCFEDEQGRVKIGDFGLSISTAPRAESLMTQTGAMVGTPAYCSPEQLRGDELNSRSDLYAVGVMLFQLLTGRLPFEGGTMPQLVANALEQRPPSPRRFRQEIPEGLARAVLRCLAKDPSDRFRGYAELRKALSPFGTAAPTPATLGRRFAAGVIDVMLWGLFGQLFMLLLFGDPFRALELLARGGPAPFLTVILPTFLAMILYYALTEWRWGATVGKALCRVRVVQPGGSPPSIGKALLRAVCYTMVPVLPFWAVLFVGDPSWLVSRSGVGSLFSLLYYVLLGMLFVTARRRNGFAAVHDLVTGTRVVSRAVGVAQRAPGEADLAEARVDEAAARVGPYHVLRPLGTSGDAEWLEGYDMRLLRRVLIRKVAAGTPPWPPALARIARIGRVRWLAGRRSPGENWDAFEGIGGLPLVQLAEAPQPWARVRYWLHDLAEELAAAARDGTVPPRLATDRVWITEDGRAKLFDVPVPGSGDMGVEPAVDAKGFLGRVAATALGGPAGRVAAAAEVRRPIPLHARDLLGRLVSLPDAEAAASALRPLLRRAAEVTRLRRAVLLAGCLVFPLVAVFSVLFGFTLLNRWEQEQPEVMELHRLLSIWETGRNPLVDRDSFPSDEQFGTYIAAHYGEFIQGDEAWSVGMARALISPRARAFAERSVEAYAVAEGEGARRAEEALAPLVEAAGLGSLQNLMNPPFLLLLPSLVLFFYVGLPAIAAALLFRGGLVLLASGVAFVRRDGRRASRLRLLWRAILTWTPVVGAFVAAGFGVGIRSAWPGALALAALAVLVAASMALPVRGLQDRLAGTWPVIR